MPLNCALKVVQMRSFMLCVFDRKKLEKNVEKETPERTLLQNEGLPHMFFFASLEFLPVVSGHRGLGWRQRPPGSVARLSLSNPGAEQAAPPGRPEGEWTQAHPGAGQLVGTPRGDWECRTTEAAPQGALGSVPSGSTQH